MPAPHWRSGIKQEGVAHLLVECAVRVTEDDAIDLLKGLVYPFLYAAGGPPTVNKTYFKKLYEKYDHPLRLTKFGSPPHSRGRWIEQCYRLSSAKLLM